MTDTAHCQVISGTPGYATGGGVSTYDASGNSPGGGDDLRLGLSGPWPGSAIANYNTGWTAAMTSESTSQTESFQTWVMCLYRAS